jgi:ABC-type lipoprotein release transport system permease subunit
MTGGAVLTAASAGAARRLVQTIVIFLVLAAGAAAALLGLAMATSSNEAFQTAFTARHGADLAVTVDAAKVTGGELARTRHLPGVTQAAGPYPETTIGLSISIPGLSIPPGYKSGSGLTVVGRASPSAPLDDITQNRGRWVARPGEVDLAIYSPVRGPVGRALGTATVTSVPGKPKLTIVGYAASVVQDEDGWVVPSEITALEKAGAPAQEQMLYTFRDGSTLAQIKADVAELKAALPAGAITSYVSWLNTENNLAAVQAVTTPFLVAYAVIGLLLTVVITAIVAAAAVAASYHRIGVLKSIGFTPAQVAATYLAQLGIPALAGAVAGTAAGSRWALPLIDTGPFHISVGIPLWISVSLPLGICALAGLAAAVPAVRAGRLSAVQAIAAGQVPRARHGLRAHLLAAKLRLPRPASLGLAAPFSRPAAALATIAVITFGLAAVVLGVGLGSQMAQIVFSAGGATIGVSLVRRLTLLVAALAGLGVFSLVLMLARERVHDLGVFKAVGMTPRQLITTVTCWIIAPAVAAAVIALPAGVALEGAVARAVVSVQTSPQAEFSPGEASLPPQGAAPRRPPHGAPPRRPPHGAPPRLAPQGGHIVAGSRLGFGAPVGLAHVYTPGVLALLALAGLAIAIAGALGPAAWAAASKTTTALRAE